MMTEEEAAQRAREVRIYLETWERNFGEEGYREIASALYDARLRLSSAVRTHGLPTKVFEVGLRRATQAGGPADEG